MGRDWFDEGLDYDGAACRQLSVAGPREESRFGVLQATTEMKKNA